MERLEYFVRRLLLVIPTFLGITFMAFGLTQFIPGGPVEQAIMRMRGLGGSEGPAGAGDAVSVSDAYREQIEAYYGFNQPFAKRYWHWLVTNRIGLQMESYKFPNKTAWQLISSRLPVSLIFGITGFVLSYLICIPLGIVKALRHGGTFDFVSSILVFAGYAIMPITLGMLLKMLFCGTVEGLWDFFPVAGFESDRFRDLSFPGKVADRFHFMFAADEKFPPGSNRARLHPNGSGKGRDVKASHMGSRTAKCPDPDCHGLRIDPDGHVRRLRHCGTDL
jgi:microcin C transport system permease protein